MTNTKLIRVVEKDLVGGAVEDGDYEFVISEYGPPNNLIEYFHFVDGSGDPADAGAGTVKISFSSGADIFQDIPNGFFSMPPRHAQQHDRSQTVTAK